MTTTLVSVRIDTLTSITSHWKAIAYFPDATTTTNVKNRIDFNLSVLFPIWRSSLKKQTTFNFTTLQLVSPRNDVWVTRAEITYWRRHYPDLGSAFDWSWRERNLFHPISRRTTQIWVVNVISMREFLQSLLGDVISWWRREVSTVFFRLLKKEAFRSQKKFRTFARFRLFRLLFHEKGVCSCRLYGKLINQSISHILITIWILE